jgi:hypothetical protein
MVDLSLLLWQMTPTAQGLAAIVIPFIGSVKFGFALGIIVTLLHVGFLTDSFVFHRISNLSISKRTLQTEITEANKFFVLPAQINL